MDGPFALYPASHAWPGVQEWVVLRAAVCVLDGHIERTITGMIPPPPREGKGKGIGLISVHLQPYSEHHTCTCTRYGMLGELSVLEVKSKGEKIT